ncbi:MAG: hypothetical protein KME26_18130 [Oscillatoria princeps RMCB-10]|nr:hypothetical protein [Oscillatoria princeps RMCB-10]
MAIWLWPPAWGSRWDSESVARDFALTKPVTLSCRLAPVLYIAFLSWMNYGPETRFL